jgi:hypothetical protein
MSGLVHRDPELVAYRSDSQTATSVDPDEGALPFLIMFGAFVGVFLGSGLKNALSTNRKKYIA